MAIFVTFMIMTSLAGARVIGKEACMPDGGDGGGS
jgi:hypothetical protein